MSTVNINFASIEDILIVDDNKPDLKLLSEVLKKAGYATRLVTNGEQALRSAQTKLPSLILLAINMSELDGYEVCRRLKASEDTRDIPVIFIRSRSNPIEIAKTFDAGGVDYISKPFEPEEILIRVATHLTLRMAQKEIEEKKRRLQQEIVKHKQMEKEIQESEELYRDLVENSTDFICTHDLEGNFLWANQAATHITGYSREAFLKMKISDLLVPEYRPYFKDYLAEVKSKGRASGVMKAKTATGETRFWEYQNSLRIDGVKKPVVRGISRDITEQKQAEMALQESEERYRAVVENSHDGILIIGEDYRFIYANNKLCEIIGLKREEIIGHDFREFLDEDAKKIVADRFMNRQRDKKLSPRYELNIVGGDGKKRRVEVSSAVVKDSKGKIRTIGQLLDITERKRAEEALKREKEKFQILIEKSPLGVSIIGKNHNYKYVNPKFTEIFGYTLEDISTGQEWFAKAYPDKKYRDQAFAAWINDRKVTKHGEPMPQTFTVRCKDGSEKVIYFRAVIMETGDEFITYEDITEQKKAEQEKKKLEARLSQAQKMEAIGVLAGGVAHDFNNILTSIIGNADLTLMKLDRDTPGYQNIEEIIKAGQRAADLTRQLLAFSRKELIRPDVLNLNRVAVNLEKMLRRIIGEDIDLVTVYAPGLWQVKADQSQMEQVIMNLSVNARDAMPKGGKLTIETANVELSEKYFREHGTEGRPGPCVMLAVTDSGVGMDRKTQARIFEPFFTTKEMGRGTGLGLSTVYGIVKQNRGHIWVYSEPEKGTTFKVYLPKAEIGTGNVKKEQLAKRSLTGTATILIVEDDDMLRDMAGKMLKGYGYNVTTARDAKEAIKISENHDAPIHVLLTDVVMPGMNGRELATQLQKKIPGIKVLYMSGYTSNAIVHHGVLENGVNFIQKPFAQEALASKVQKVLTKPD